MYDITRVSPTVYKIPIKDGSHITWPVSAIFVQTAALEKLQLKTKAMYDIQGKWCQLLYASLADTPGNRDDPRIKGVNIPKIQLDMLEQFWKDLVPVELAFMTFAHEFCEHLVWMLATESIATDKLHVHELASLPWLVGQYGFGYRSGRVSQSYSSLNLALRDQIFDPAKLVQPGNYLYIDKYMVSAIRLLGNAFDSAVSDMSQYSLETSTFRKQNCLVSPKRLLRMKVGSTQELS